MSCCSIKSVDPLTVFLFAWMVTLFLNEIAQKSIICVFFRYSSFSFYCTIYRAVYCFWCFMKLLSNWALLYVFWEILKFSVEPTHKTCLTFETCERTGFEMLMLDAFFQYSMSCRIVFDNIKCFYEYQIEGFIKFFEKYTLFRNYLISLDIHWNSECIKLKFRNS